MAAAIYSEDLGGHHQGLGSLGQVCASDSILCVKRSHWCAFEKGSNMFRFVFSRRISLAAVRILGESRQKGKWGDQLGGLCSNPCER